VGSLLGSHENRDKGQGPRIRIGLVGFGLYWSIGRRDGVEVALQREVEAVAGGTEAGN